MPEVFTCKVKLLMGINDRPGVSGVYRVDKHPSHVGACYSCEHKGMTMISKTIYPCRALFIWSYALPIVHAYALHPN